MEQAEAVRFGVIGAGRIARQSFAPALARTARARLVAAASRDRDRARALGPERVHDSYAALLDDPEVEAVYIATHNGLHRPLTLQALAAGKHVLCEKPLGCNAAECDEMARAAEAADRLLVEAFMYRHHPQIHAAKRRLEEGVIGELRTVEAAFSFPLTQRDDVRLNPSFGGGALLDVGCYCVNVSRLFLGNDVESVIARGHFDPVHAIDRALHGVLDHGAGHASVISCGFDAGLRNHVILSGTAGVMTLPHAFLSWRYTPQLEIQGDGVRRVEQFLPVDVFQLEIEDFCGALREARPPLLGPREGWHNARIMDALLASARAGGAATRP